MKRDVAKKLAYAVVTLTAVAACFVAVGGDTVSAHAPIEWSDPPNDAVVERVPESISVRFAEEPVSVTMRTIEPEPRKGVEVTPERTSERTYRVRIPEGTITSDDNTMVLFIETKARDGHTASGVYLLHVKTKKDDTTASASTATTKVPVETTASTSETGGTNTDPTRGEFVPPKKKDSALSKQAAAAALILVTSIGTLGVRKNKKQNTRQKRSRK